VAKVYPVSAPVGHQQESNDVVARKRARLRLIS
jgi:hypothetical protein